MDMLKQLSLAGLVPVIKVKHAEDAVPLCTALKNGGLPVAEITFRTDAAEEAIRLVHEALPDVLLGAGTVLTTDQADRAFAAGASYIVSPGLNPEVVRHCQSKGYPVLPGCANPSDVEAALNGDPAASSTDVERHPRMAPFRRRCRVSARVSTPSMPGTPWRMRKSGRLSFERQLEGSLQHSLTMSADMWIPPDSMSSGLIP